MEVKIKKILEGARLPQKATEGSAAYDLYVPTDTIIETGRQIVPLGFAMEMEPGYEALIDPRSGFSAKGMEGYLIEKVFNTPPISLTRSSDEVEEEMMHLQPSRFNCDVIEGKIDSDYRDGVGVIVHNRSARFIIKAGTRIAQMTFHKVETVRFEESDELSSSEREGGFGSTGTK